MSTCPSLGLSKRNLLGTGNPFWLLIDPLSEAHHNLEHAMVSLWLSTEKNMTCCCWGLLSISIKQTTKGLVSIQEWPRKHPKTCCQVEFSSFVSSSSWGYPIAGCLMSGKIPSRSGWWLGVPLFWETPTSLKCFEITNQIWLFLSKFGHYPGTWDGFSSVHLRWLLAEQIGAQDLSSASRQHLVIFSWSTFLLKFPSFFSIFERVHSILNCRGW